MAEAKVPEAARHVRRAIAESGRPSRRARPAGAIDLSSGDPDFSPPSHVRAALVEAAGAGYSNYPPSDGDPELREAIAERVAAAAGTGWDWTDVLVTAGATGAVLAAMAAYLDPGDAVLLPQPTYSLYADVTRLLGAEPVWVDLDAYDRLDPDALRSAARRASPRAKLLVLNTPNNPTGVVHSREELEGAARVAAEFGLLVLADEVYDQLVYDGVPFVSTMAVPALRERLILCQSLSKTYAITGWRLGYVAAGRGLLAPVSQVARSASGGVAWPVQRAGLAALTGPAAPIAAMQDEYAARRGLVADLLAGVPGLRWMPPEGAFYAWLGYDAPVPAQAMQARLRESGVLVRAGTEYGPAGEGRVRLAFATDRASLEEGIRRLVGVVAKGTVGHPEPVVVGGRYIRPATGAVTAGTTPGSTPLGSTG